MFNDEGVKKVLAALPRQRFADVDATRPREVFAKMGPEGANDAFFEVAWASLGRHFQDVVAGTRHASKLVELGQRDRIKAYLKQLAESSAPRRDESAELAAYRRSVYGQYKLADTRGLFWREKETTGEEIRLDEIFVWNGCAETER